jgi:hypothetical protein
VFAIFPGAAEIIPNQVSPAPESSATSNLNLY